MEATEFINKNKKILINAGIILIALFISGKIYQQQNKTIESLRQQKEEVIKKNEVLSNISVLEKRVGLYANLFNKKDADYSINTIGNVARESNIKITSIKPSAEQKSGQYTKVPLDLSVSAPGYHALAKFISRVENLKDVYIVDSLSANFNEQGKQLIVNLRVSTVVIK